jgi:hypothetical protein
MKQAAMDAVMYTLGAAVARCAAAGAEYGGAAREMLKEANLPI